MVLIAVLFNNYIRHKATEAQLMRRRADRRAQQRSASISARSSRSRTSRSRCVRGEVCCLLGDNGAGKSTLIKILSGVHPPSSRRGPASTAEPVRFASPRDALDRGIATVYQDLATVPLMSIMRNFFMGREPVTRLGAIFQRFDHAPRQHGRRARRWRGSASASAIRARPSARFRAASANAWRSPARSISAPGC